MSSPSNPEQKEDAPKDIEPRLWSAWRRFNADKYEFHEVAFAAFRAGYEAGKRSSSPMRKNDRDL